MSIRAGLRRARVVAILSTALGGIVAPPAWADGPFPDLPKLKLTINTTTASVTLGNEDSLSVDVDFYEIHSDTNSLVPANWTSLQFQKLPGFPAGDGSGNGWEVFGIPSSKRLAEGFYFGDSTFDPGTLLHMGLVFDRTIPNPQISLRYAVADGAPFGIVDGTLVDGIVQYVTSAPPMPDVNGDGSVNIFDINLISAHWNENGPVGDANSDGAVNIFDVNLVSANWTPTGGGTAVPEPATIALLLTGLVSLLAVRPRGQAGR